MNDYKELIVKCDEWIAKADNFGADDLANHISRCADAIEQLVNDRNASVDALKALGSNIDVLPTRSGHWLLKFHGEETEEAIRLIIALCAEQNGTEASE